MSARNYANCPRCAREAGRLFAEKQAIADAAYGVKTVNEYEKLKRAANQVEAIPGTLGEYYELWFTQAGEFKFRYSAACRKCGFEFSTEHQVPDAVRDVE